MKKILLIGCILLCIGLLTGCGNNISDNQAGAMNYEDPVGFKNKISYDFGDSEVSQVAIYSFEEETKKITLHFDAKSSIDKVFPKEKYETKKINGKEWRIFTKEEDGIKSENYYTQYKNDLYYVEFSNIESFVAEEVQAFLDNITFD